MAGRNNTLTRWIGDMVDDTKDFVDDILDRAGDVEDAVSDVSQISAQLATLSTAVENLTTIVTTDAVSAVGGNRYGWFTDVTVTGGLAIDNVTLDPIADRRGGPHRSHGREVI